MQKTMGGIVTIQNIKETTTMTKTKRKTIDIYDRTIKAMDMIKLPCNKYLGLACTATHKNLVNLQILCSGLHNKRCYGATSIHGTDGHLTIYIERTHNVTAGHMNEKDNQMLKQCGRSQFVTIDKALSLLSPSSVIMFAMEEKDNKPNGKSDSKYLDRDQEDKVYLAEVIAYLKSLTSLKPAVDVTPQQQLPLVETDASNIKPASDTIHRPYSADEFQQKMDELNSLIARVAMQTSRVTAAEAQAVEASRKAQSEKEMLTKLEQERDRKREELRLGKNA
jgi:hypothetical protein